ncbi:hypothetical protein HQ535_04100 [bacterium]|nr:hypothetical protein [bacterium]
MDPDREELEHIPWSELRAQQPDGRRRMVYLVAGAVAAASLGALAARALASPGVPAAPGPSVVSASTTIPQEVAAAMESTTTSTVRLYSEADLMAYPIESAELAAVARAEWFVTDYFTADLEPTGSADIRTALAVGVELPSLPQDGGEGLSYVEWARAFSVMALGDGTFRVGVVYRALGAPPDRGFVRLPVRAVTVDVATTVDGGSVVIDLPSPVSLPAGPEPEEWPGVDESPPSGVVDSAVGWAAGWGAEPRVVASQRGLDEWRIVLTFADEVGNRWPLSIEVTE